MKPLSSVETMEDRIEAIKRISPGKAPSGRNRASAAVVHNRVQRARHPGGFKAPKLRSLLPRFGVTMPHRPATRGPALRAAARRCTVKVNYTKNRKPDQWEAHGRYLEREEVQKTENGEKIQAHGFNAETDMVSMPATLNHWQIADDPHLFKVILAPEDPMDAASLRSYTRDFMRRMSSEMGKDLEWAAIDHHNTSHPHVHLLIRGKNNLQIEPDMIRRGMRAISSDILTEKMGYRTEMDVLRARELEITARRFTQLDRDIQSRAKRDVDSDYAYVQEPMVAEGTPKEMMERRLRQSRLEALTQIGVADKVAPVVWRLEPGWDKALKELQILQTRSKMLSEARALMTEPRCVPQVTKLHAGERLVGRILGTGLDEQNERSYLLIEGTDNRAHIVYQTASMQRARSEQKLGLRHLVALTGLDRGVGVEDYGAIIPDSRWHSTPIPEKALDDELDYQKKMKVEDSQAPTTGFAAYWHRKLLERKKVREQERGRAENQKTIPDNAKRRSPARTKNKSRGGIDE
ncbi:MULTISPECIES: DUF3363 domain-containing protein [Acidithiobacillus]|nr:MULTISPECIES: DUF3363 domain-containing protein [Acidithiobacillus]MDA8175741.1 DUF3363 domain-containing protein [Acidithiobacillus sp.]